jgi:hypothetical protein
VSGDIFPFDLDGVTVVSETEIQYEGKQWQAGKGRLVGQFSLRPGWLRQGGIVETEPEGELWLAGTETLEPSVGPAWVGCAYIPTPEYVRQQVIRRRAGLPLGERRWQEIRANQGRGANGGGRPLF